MQQGLYNYIIQTMLWNICFWTFQGVRKISSCDSYLSIVLGYWYCWFLQLFIAKIMLTGLNKRTRLIWTQVCESFLTQSSGLDWCPYSILQYLLLVLVLLACGILTTTFVFSTVPSLSSWSWLGVSPTGSVTTISSSQASSTLLPLKSCWSWFATAGQLSFVKLIGLCSERSFYRTITGLKNRK